MADDIKNTDRADRAAGLDPKEINPVVSTSASTRESADPVDPVDEIPVPVAMSPAEIDERAQAVEAVRGNLDPESRMEA